MTFTLAEVVIRLARVERLEVVSWVEHGWLRPARDVEGAEPVFGDVDLARAQLICELRHDLDVDEETLPLVLGLIDQLYAERRRVNALTEAIQRQPEDVRRAILTALGVHHEPRAPER